MSVKTPARARKTRRPVEAQAGQSQMGGFEVLLLLIAIIGGLHLLVMLGLETSRTLHTRHEIHQLSNAVAVLQGQNAQLQAVIAHGDDPTYREELARLQGFVYPKEDRYVSVPGPQADTGQR